MKFGTQYSPSNTYSLRKYYKCLTEPHPHSILELVMAYQASKLIYIFKKYA